MKLYFAYGANLNLDQMRFRCPAARPVNSLMLENWQLEFDLHATIRPHTGSSVPGCVWEITDGCELSLDVFEGYPTYYTKQTVVQNGVEYMVYVMNSTLTSPPRQSYVTTVAEGYMDWDLPFDHLESALERSKSANCDIIKLT